MTKAEARQHYQRMRGTLGQGDVSSMSYQLCEKFMQHFGHLQQQILMGFAGIARHKEPDMLPLMHTAAAKGVARQLALPHMQQERGRMQPVLYTKGMALTHNATGVPEVPNPQPLHPEDLDIVLIPLLCIDGSGHRVGFGGGYYDRFLVRTRPGCLKIGIGFFPPIELIEDISEHDVPLDAYLTPTGLLQF